jgi:LuxR family transcriptional regulator, quorum-sensing system regulator BjaR1
LGYDFWHALQQRFCAAEAAAHLALYCQKRMLSNIASLIDYLITKSYSVDGMATPAQSLFEVVDRIAAANSIPEVWNAYLSVANDVGLPNAAACTAPRNTDSAIHVVGNAMPKTCLESYASNSLFSGDLAIARAKTSNTSFHWALEDWPLAEMSPIQKRWREHCEAFGLRSGLCILDFKRGDDMVLWLSGPDGTLSTRDRLALYFSGREALMRIRELRSLEPSNLIMLSRRERECLQWAAMGKTDWETGQILTLSEKTVNIYINRAKTKFGVETRAQALVLASQAGLIGGR